MLQNASLSGVPQQGLWSNESTMTEGVVSQEGKTRAQKQGRYTSKRKKIRLYCDGSLAPLGIWWAKQRIGPFGCDRC